MDRSTIIAILAIINTIIILLAPTLGLSAWVVWALGVILCVEIFALWTATRGRA